MAEQRDYEKLAAQYRQEAKEMASGAGKAPSKEAQQAAADAAARRKEELAPTTKTEIGKKKGGKVKCMADGGMAQAPQRRMGPPQGMPQGGRPMGPPQGMPQGGRPMGPPPQGGMGGGRPMPQRPAAAPAGMKKGGKAKCMAKGGYVKTADGCAVRGKTRGRMV